MLLNRFRINRVSLLLAIFSIAMWIYVYLSLAQAVLVTGDSGQWIMLARFYRGQTVPSYIKPMAYPPVYPVSLAAAITLTGNAVQGVNILGATIVVFLGISFFVVGKELWDSTAGFLALLIGFIGQHFFLYATSWGAYPQLLFLAWINLAISRFVIISRDSSVARRQYLYFAFFLGLGLFTHFPSSIILVAVFAVPGIHFLTVMKAQEVRSRVKLLLAFSIPFVVWAIYVSFLINETIGYLENEAALLSRGVNTVWASLFRSPESSAFVIASVVASAFCVAYVSRKRPNSRSYGFFFVPSWMFSTVILMCVLYLLGVKTEYTRFTYLLVPPLVLSLAGALSALVSVKARFSLDIEGLKSYGINVKRFLWPLIILFLLLPFPSIHAFYTKSIQYYSAWEPEDFSESLEWIERNIAVSDTILTTGRAEGRKLEGLTGRTALFSFPERASYRPWEHDRSIASDTILRSSIAIENGYILVKFEKDYRSIPIQPSISVCRDGDYEDALWLRDSLTRITLVDSRNNEQTLSIREFPRVSHEVTREPEAIYITSRFEKGVNRTVLYLNRRITITKDSPVVSVHYSILTTDSFYAKNLSIGILDPWGQTRRNTEVDNELRLVYKTAAKQDMVVHVTWGNSDGSVSERPISNKDHRIATWLTFFPNATTSAKLDVRITAAPTGRLINGLRFFEAPQLVAQYNVGAALLLKDENAWFKVINLRNLGFDVAFENDSYIVMVRSTGV